MGQSKLFKVLVAGSLVLSGCSMKEKLDGMIEKTDNMDKNTTSMAKTTTTMSETTKRMEEVTREMSETTKGMDATTKNTYGDLRQGSSVTIVSERQKAMEEATSLEAKIVEAGKLVMAFEFQLLKTKGEPVESKDHVYEVALKDFFAIVTNYMDKKPAVKVGKGGDMENIYALSAVIHRINPNQLEHAAKEGTTPPSIYSLIQEALQMGVDIKAGKKDYKSIPTWAREVLREEHTIVLYLLQIRYNFLASMPLGKISDIKKGGLNKAKMRFFSWTADVSRLNAAELEFESMKMEYALETRDFLKSIGVEPIADKNLVKIYEHMKLSEGTVTAAGTEGADLISRLKANIANFLSGGESE